MKDPYNTTPGSSQHWLKGWNPPLCSMEGNKSYTSQNGLGRGFSVGGLAGIKFFCTPLPHLGVPLPLYRLGGGAEILP